MYSLAGEEVLYIGGEKSLFPLLGGGVMVEAQSVRGKKPSRQSSIPSVARIITHFPLFYYCRSRRRAFHKRSSPNRPRNYFLTPCSVRLAAETG